MSTIQTVYKVGRHYFCTMEDAEKYAVSMISEEEVYQDAKGQLWELSVDDRHKVVLE